MAALHESIKAMSIDDDEQHYIGWLIYSPHFLEDGTKSYEKTHKSWLPIDGTDDRVYASVYVRVWSMALSSKDRYQFIF